MPVVVVPRHHHYIIRKSWARAPRLLQNIKLAFPPAYPGARLYNDAQAHPCSRVRAGSQTPQAPQNYENSLRSLSRSGRQQRVYVCRKLL